MIPLIYVGYAVITIVIALASIQVYQTSEAVWNAYDDTKDKVESLEGIGGGLMGLALLGIGLMFMTRRN